MLSLLAYIVFDGSGGDATSLRQDSFVVVAVANYTAPLPVSHLLGAATQGASQKREKGQRQQHHHLHDRFPKRTRRPLGYFGSRPTPTRGIVRSVSMFHGGWNFAWIGVVSARNLSCDITAGAEFIHELLVYH
jgi:hypothetical protein